MSKESFEQQFRQRLDEIIDRGEKIGFTLSHICRETGISRATPDRWRKCLPKTIELVDQMDAAVTAAEQAKSGTV